MDCAAVSGSVVGLRWASPVIEFVSGLVYVCSCRIARDMREVR